jgi:hypothetical protein
MRMTLQELLRTGRCDRPTPNFQRLYHLRTVLARVQPDSFDIDCWAKLDKGRVKACALGWAGLDSIFRKQGLTTNTASNLVMFDSGVMMYTSLAAGMAFFGLNIQEASYLFTANDGGKSLAASQARLNKLIASFEKRFAPTLPIDFDFEKLAAVPERSYQRLRRAFSKRPVRELVDA